VSTIDDRESVRIERPATGGGVAHLSDGRVVFVRHSLPGETVQVRLTESSKNFARGEAVEILEASPERVIPVCPVAVPGGCGGCDLQHASPTAQREWKIFLVQDHLQRIAGIDVELKIEPTPEPAQNTRTRLRCAVTESGQLALRAARSHDLVPISECVASDAVFGPAFENSWGKVDEVELRAIGDGQPFAVVRRGELYDVVALDGTRLHPDTQSRVSVRNFVHSVGPRSFWQSHRDGPEVLVNQVLAYAQLGKGDHAVDLFSGVGLFSIAMAKEVGPTGKVVAVESSAFSVKDARQNAQGFPWVKIREWTVSARAINDAVMENDVVVLDPPRIGLAKGVVEALARRRPRRVVYVSCDAATFARDLALFEENGIELQDMKVYDLFPMTEHVEIVALLIPVETD
jgi:tRNA/tmRNA/rRNA uracil-C5-methylase (TrmA/RlmC/RlmD family)